uniref:Uncharacterized protein n=1 Tax=Octopus bimaculoides TaxID=37653 RepID=A0A0L8FLY0_OCTBM
MKYRITSRNCTYIDTHTESVETINKYTEEHTHQHTHTAFVERAINETMYKHTHTHNWIWKHSHTYSSMYTHTHTHTQPNTLTHIQVCTTSHQEVLTFI